MLKKSLKNITKKILEVGVAAGTTSALMLDAIKNTNARLYSADLNELHYCQFLPEYKSKKTGL